MADRQILAKVNIWNPCPPWSRHHPWITPSACSQGLSIDACPVCFCLTHFPLYIQKDVSSAYLINSNPFKFSNGLPMPRRGESVFLKVPLGPSLSFALWSRFGPSRTLSSFRLPAALFLPQGAWMPVPSASSAHPAGLRLDSSSWKPA